MKLADIIDYFIAGDWGDEAISTDNSNAVFCVRGADIVPISNHKFDDIPQRFISDRSIQTKMLRAGDIVVEKSGGSPTQSTGRVVYISEELIKAKRNLVCSNFCTAIRINPSWNPLYVYYYWQNVYNAGVFFNFEGKTSGIKNLQLENALAAIDIEYIPLEKQNEIVKVLSAIDQKIAINRAINQNLEAMAKQLYDYWFVQFDFPDDNGRPYKSSGGKMVWNEKLSREIPEGWDYKSLRDIESNIVTGKTPSTADESNFGGKIPFITIDDIRKYPFIYNTVRTLSEKGAGTQAKKYLEEGSLCCSCIGTTGVIGFVGKKGQTNQQINSIVFNEAYNKEFLYFSLKLHFANASAKVGNILPNMNKDEFSMIPILYPKAELLEEYHCIVNDMFSQINNNVKEIITLTKQRDELLPLLMNDQATVNSDLSHYSK